MQISLAFWGCRRLGRDNACAEYVSHTKPARPSLEPLTIVLSCLVTLSSPWSLVLAFSFLFGGLCLTLGVGGRQMMEFPRICWVGTWGHGARSED